jgi:hypothetical protein
MEIGMNTEKAAKLIRMLSSDNDGEVLAAARQLAKIGVHEVAERVAQSVTASGNGVFIDSLDRATDQFLSEYKKWERHTKFLMTALGHSNTENKRLRDELECLVKNHLAETERLIALADHLRSKLAKLAERICLMCGGSFVARRSDATTCSPRCRTAVHRRNRRNG